MSSEQQEVAELVRSGRYFDEARRWYQALYIGPISERSFFLLLAGLAVLVALMAFFAMEGMLPLVERPGLLIHNPDVGRKALALYPLRQQGEGGVSQALERFFVLNYVRSREAYAATDYGRDSAYVRAHSDGPTLQQYEALYGSANPRSPANVLGERGKREVVLKDFSSTHKDTLGVATVKFSTELKGVGITAKTQWTAVVSYYYSPLRVEQDPSGETHLEDPQFKVVNYVVTQTP